MSLWTGISTIISKVCCPIVNGFIILGIYTITSESSGFVGPTYGSSGSYLAAPSATTVSSVPKESIYEASINVFSMVDKLF
jgi:hypothetical protein